MERMDTNQDEGHQGGNEFAPRRKPYPDTDASERHWKFIRNSFRQQYSNITDEYVTYREGEFDVLSERVAQRTNRKKQNAKNDIRNWNRVEEK